MSHLLQDIACLGLSVSGAFHVFALSNEAYSWAQSRIAGGTSCKQKNLEQNKQSPSLNPWPPSVKVDFSCLTREDSNFSPIPIYQERIMRCHCTSISLLLVVTSHILPFQSLANVEFPSLIDSDDLAYYFERDDLDGLHWALSNVFRRSQRNPNPSEILNNLPQQIISRGGGSTYTTEYKLAMDLEQAEYLAQHLENKELASFFLHTVKPVYEKVLTTMPPLESLQRTHGLYSFRPTDGPDILALYNKALHQTNFEELKDSDGRLVPLLNPELDTELIERQWFGQDPKHKNPGIVVIDNLLSSKALFRIRQLMLESTVWYQTKMPLKFGGYVGACESHLLTTSSLPLIT